MFKTNFKDLIKTKTFWAGVTGCVGAASGFFTGTIDADTALTAFLVSLLAIFQRDGINKQKGVRSETDSPPKKGE